MNSPELQVGLRRAGCSAYPPTLPLPPHFTLSKGHESGLYDDRIAMASKTAFHGLGSRKGEPSEGTPNQVVEKKRLALRRATLWNDHVAAYQPSQSLGQSQSVIT